MLWGRSKATQVYLSGTAMLRRLPAGPVKVSHHENPKQALSSLADDLKQDRSTAVQLWLGGPLCRIALTSPIEGARDRDELEAALTAALRARGVARKAEVVRSIALNNGTEPVLVALIHAAVLEAVSDLRKAGVRVQSVRPWWAGFAEQFAKAAPTESGTKFFAAFDGEVLTTASTDVADHIRAAGTLELGPSLEEARKVVTRLTSLQPNCLSLCVSMAAPLDQVAEAGGGEDFAFADRVVAGETF